MQPALIAITLAALVLCALMAAVTWRLLRDERRRSAARVALLEAGLREVGPEPPSTVRATVAADTAAWPGHVERPGTPTSALPFRPAAGADGDPTAIAADVRPADAIVLHHVPSERAGGGVPLADSAMFATTAGAPGFGQRTWAVAAIGILIVVAAVVAVVTTMTGGSGRGARALGAGGAPAAAVPSQPLELTALDHRRDGDTLQISGEVRNPNGGSPLTDLTAVVLFFDRHGALLTSSSATIEPSTLTPGGQAPFAVSLGRAGAVGRYRVSFKSVDRVVPHLDRRDAAAALRAER